MQSRAEEEEKTQKLVNALEELGFEGTVPSGWVPMVAELCEALMAERDATKLLTSELLDARRLTSNKSSSSSSSSAKKKEELVKQLFERVYELTDKLEAAEMMKKDRMKKTKDERDADDAMTFLREDLEQQKRLTNRIAAERDQILRANGQLESTVESRDRFDALGETEGYEIALKLSREENKTLREDIDRLKQTIDALDAQRVDLSEKFQRSHLTLREAEARAKQAEEKLEGLFEEQRKQSEEKGTSSFISSEFLSHNSRKNGNKAADAADTLTKALEIERDRLQQECDALTEALNESEARLQSANKDTETAKASEAKAVRERNATEKLRRQEIEKAQQLDQSLADALKDAKSAREETKKHREELRFVAEDLVAMTREQQNVNDDYLRACTERDRAWKDLQHAERALENVEVNSVSTTQELQDVAKAYRDLEGEHKITVRELSTTTSDNQKLEKALQQTEEGLRLAKERSRVLVSENRTLNAETRNLERRVSQLTKEIEASSTTGGKGDFAPNSLGSLSEQLEEVTKTCEDLKRQNEWYRKQHTDVESEFRALRNKLEESSQERDRLSLRVKLESNRAEELEGLLATTRAKEYEFSMATEEDSRRLKLLKERVDALSEDNDRLTNRLDALNATNAQLSNELERMKTDSAGSSKKNKSTKDSESQTLNAARNLAKSLAHSESIVLEQKRRMREISEETKDLRERVEEAESRAASAASLMKQAESKAKRSSARESELRTQLQDTVEDLRVAREASKNYAEEVNGFSANGDEFETLKRSLNEAIEEKEKLQKELRRSSDLGVIHDTNVKQLNDMRIHVDRLDALLRERDRELLDTRTRVSELLEEMNQAKLLNHSEKNNFDFFGSRSEDINLDNDDSKRDAFEALARTVRDSMNFEQSPPNIPEDNDESELLEELRQENESLRFKNEKLSRELDGTQEATEEMHNQLKRLSDDYNALAKTLSETLNVAES